MGQGDGKDDSFFDVSPEFRSVERFSSAQKWHEDFLDFPRPESPDGWSISGFARRGKIPGRYESPKQTKSIP
jgi:hypothetical protein